MIRDGTADELRDVPQLLGWMVLRARPDTTKEIEILVLHRQLAVLQSRHRPRGREGA
jgi:hypothetical protein